METLTFPILVGIAVPWLVALMTNDAMTSDKKRWITIFVTIFASLLVALGVALEYGMFNAEEIVQFIGVVFGVVAIVYAAFKNHGIDALRAKANKIVLPGIPSEAAVVEATAADDGNVAVVKEEETDEVIATVEETEGDFEVSVPPNTGTVSASIKDLNGAGLAAATTTPTALVSDTEDISWDDLVPLDEETFFNVPPARGRHVAS